MEKKVKTQLKTFSTTKKYHKRSGVTITLDDLLVDIRKSEKRLGIQLPDNSDPVNLLEYCHPYLYFNYAVNWRQMPSQLIPSDFNDGVEFARSVIRDWHDFCWKKHLALIDELNNYDSVDRLAKYNDELLAAEGEDLQLPAGYDVHVERLYQRRQEELDNEASAYEEEQRRLQQERELALAEDRAREANKKADELRRLQQAQENAEQAQRNREFSQQRNSPWSTSVTAKAEEKQDLTLPTFERSLQRFFTEVYDYYVELSSDGQAAITSCGINYIASDFWWQVKVCIKYKLEGVQTEEAILGAAPAMADALRKAIGQFDERKHTHQHIFEMRAEKKRKAEERRRKEEEKATLQSQLDQLLAQAAALQKQMAQM